MSEIPDDIWEAARGLRYAVCWQSNSAVEFIAKALNAERLAAEQRGREMEREECAKEVTSLAARFAVHSQNPSKSEDVAEICRINERMLDGLAAAIRSRTEG